MGPTAVVLCSLCRGKTACGPGIIRALWKCWSCLCLAAASLRRRAPLALIEGCEADALDSLDSFLEESMEGISKGQTGRRRKERQQEERGGGSCPNSNCKISCIPTNPKLFCS